MGPSLSLCVPLGPRPTGSRCGGTQPVGGACITTAFSTEFSGSTRAMQVPESGGAPGVWLVRLVLAMFPCLLRPQDTALLATLFPLGFACAAPSTYYAVPSALDWPAPHIPGASAWGTVERQDAQQGRERPLHLQALRHGSVRNPRATSGRQSRASDMARSQATGRLLVSTE